ncbi:DUF1934 domain-containing protein [Cohnella fermenti]|uniref:DUF1934 domain-containing protein n=1 Tax=Cohnella fermenti TaxID=2565925 RepID=A0A4S4C3S3_9BACL|nr:DUF1934 domain-containing protein [Cohnella fermenti]THF81750.1 DUF1934 domain-containing protein [Cohnella fermenti]
MNGSEPRRVRIELHSGGANGNGVAEYRGMLYPKPGGCYIRYEENDEGRGRCSVTFKRDESGLTLLRHGEVQAEQSFRPGQRTAGWYASPAGRLRLEMDTFALVSKERAADGLADGPEQGDEDGKGNDAADGLELSIEWQYDLWVNDEKTDRFDLRLMIWEDNES